MNMTKNTYIPKLRFPEFSGDWGTKKLGQLVTIKSGNSPSLYSLTELGQNPFVKVEELNNCDKYLSESRFYSDDRKNFVEKNSVLFPKRGAAILNNKVRINIKDILMDSNLMALIPNTELIGSEFLYYQIIKTELYKIADTSTIPQINNKHIEPYEIIIPTIEEQTKIASFLTAVDDKLQTLKKKKELLEQYKKGMMQQLFSQEIRFKKDDGTNYPDWEWKKLSEVSIEHLTKNTRNDVTEVFSVSKHKGVINQIEHLGRSFSSKEISNYKVIFHGDLVYTKSPTSEFPFGIIKQNRTERVGVVSPLYCVFKPVTIELGYILHEYFYSHVNTFNYLNPLVQKGAKNTMNINNETFLNGAELFLPIDNDEQTKIAIFLSSIDDKIAYCQSELDGLEQWKKGLLQQLFC